MRRKNLKKVRLDQEEKEFLNKNARELEAALVNYCEKLALDFEPPFSPEEVDYILKAAKKAEFEKLLKVFPNYLSLNENEKLNAKLIVKFDLDPKLSLRDLAKINEAISRKLKASSDSSEVNLELYRFKK